MLRKTLFITISVVRWIAIIAALIYVGINLVETIKKALQGQVIVSITEKDLPEYLFPSLTVCAKFNDGHSDIIPIIWLDQWNNSGTNSKFLSNENRN